MEPKAPQTCDGEAPTARSGFFTDSLFFSESNTSPMVSPPVLVLTGPTGAGKSAAVAALARRWPVEVINVDSATIYRGMDIGTAKPSAAERQEISHHLLDIRDPAQPYSAAQFRSDALRLMREIRARGRIPMLCGGTMLYHKVLRDGLDDLPQADAALRAQLLQDAARLGWPALHARLARVDPVTATRLAPNDSQRIGRALEIYMLSGRPMADLLAQNKSTRQLAMVTISLEPSERSLLHARIAQRYHAMLEQGLLAEVQALHARADLNKDLPSMRCVGYRQLWLHLDGVLPYAQAVSDAITATRQLAKRQMTWLRAQPGRYPVDCLRGDAVERVMDLAQALVIREFAAAPRADALEDRFG